ncbi:hypothetical protein D9758_007509 [Tetrapyrgos nigripes]|uniref:TFIIS N-terminal domain-containing protein n=1 Tax=Tetrapyrgos nigripes TaxID=182062 RepID=A0A8H5LHS8_9AGAR|nr:hypothetical protein D9758_007509 [Tetrapyrgos nigripes]
MDPNFYNWMSHQSTPLLSDSHSPPQQQSRPSSSLDDWAKDRSSTASTQPPSSSSAPPLDLSELLGDLGALSLPPQTPTTMSSSLQQHAIRLFVVIFDRATVFVFFPEWRYNRSCFHLVVFPTNAAAVPATGTVAAINFLKPTLGHRSRFDLTQCDWVPTLVSTFFAIFSTTTAAATAIEFAAISLLSKLYDVPPQSYHTTVVHVLSPATATAFFFPSTPSSFYNPSHSPPQQIQQAASSSSSSSTPTTASSGSTVTTPSGITPEQRKAQFHTSVKPLLQSSSFTGAGAVNNLVQRIEDFGVLEVDPSIRLEILTKIRDGAGNHYFRAWGENTAALDITREWLRAAYAAKGEGPLQDTIMPLLHIIDRLPLTVESLKASKLGKLVVKLVKEPSSPGELGFLLYSLLRHVYLLDTLHTGQN